MRNLFRRMIGRDRRPVADAEGMDPETHRQLQDLVSELDEVTKRLVAAV